MPTPATTAVTGTIIDATGAPITGAAHISFLPVTNSGIPLSPSFEGDLIGIAAVTVPVLAGVFEVTLLDVKGAGITPQNFGYRVTATDDLTLRPILDPHGYTCFQPTGANAVLVANYAAQLTLATGPQGLSAYQVYQSTGGQLSQADWLASLQGTANDNLLRSTLQGLGVITTSSGGGGAQVLAGSSFAVAATSSGNHPVDVFAHTTPFSAAGTVEKIEQEITEAAIGDTFDVVFGTQTGTATNGDILITVNRRLTLTMTQAVSTPTVITFLAGTDFASGITVAAGDIVGWGTQGSTGYAQPSFSTSGSGSFCFASSAIAAGQSSNYGPLTGDPLIRATAVTPTVPAVSAGAAITTLQAEVASLVSGASVSDASARAALTSQGLIQAATAVTGGTTFPVAPDSAQGSNVTVYAYNQPFSATGALASISLYVSSGNVGDKINIVTGTPGAVASGAVPVVTNQRIVLTLTAAVSAQTRVTFEAGTDFPANTNVTAGDIIGWDGRTTTGYARLGFHGSIGGGFAYSATSPTVGSSESFTTITGDGLVQGAEVLAANAVAPGPTIATLEAAVAKIPQPFVGLNWVNFGDSYSATYPTVWQPYVIAKLGMPLLRQYAQGGRTFHRAQAINWIFTEFMLSDGTVDTAGLATALAGVDVITIVLGTNDCNGVSQQAYPLGVSTDYPVRQTDGTFTGDSVWGWANFVLTTLATAAPLAKIYWFGPIHVQRIAGQALPSGDFDNWYTDAVCDEMNTLLAAACASFGAVYTNLADKTGINKYNIAHPDGSAWLLRDHLHLTTQGGTRYWAPTFAAAMLAHPPQ